VTDQSSLLAIVLFFLFVGVTLGISFFLGRQAKSSKGYFAAHGQIPWFVNGVAFAGDYLSAASFLGICGMIAFYGYDGFLYSIGYLAGWIVALFVVAEPMKRLGKFTFADALDARFNSRGIRLAAGISTLAVSIFYLIPQMVGAGVLIRPLLDFPHEVGVLLVGVTVILIVVTAGMVSTTWVQFLKGSLLVIFSAVLAVLIIQRGFNTEHETSHRFASLGPFSEAQLHEELATRIGLQNQTILPAEGAWQDQPFIRTRDKVSGRITVWSRDRVSADKVMLREGQMISKQKDGQILISGLPEGKDPGEAMLYPVGRVSRLPGGEQKTGPLNPLSFFKALEQSEVILWRKKKLVDATGMTTVYFQQPTPGSQVLRPGEHPRFQGIRSDDPLAKIDFLSLMLALFCGTASLPHILIRYYTVKDVSAARKSTIVGIATIGFFYILTLYLGLGAMTSGALDLTDSNMAAPLLAKSISQWLFAVISAIAFTTVLGTVSGLILASAGAVSHDLVSCFRQEPLTDVDQVRVAKIASCVVGAIAIVLGIVFQQMNVSYLVGWAFSVAASANLPALVMLLFWKRVTRQGIVAGVLVGMISSLTWILLSGDTFEKVYGLDASAALVPFSQPGIVTIPLGFASLVIVSLLTQPKTKAD